MEQVATQCFKSKCGKSQIFVENDMPIGVFHDFLMEIKGNMVDRMVQAQKQEVEIAEQMKKQDESCQPNQEGCTA